jgi:hypothetical protein
MANQTTKSFGIFSGTGASAASGVTSVAAGDGITCTPDPITATGTVALASVSGLVSTFDGGTNVTESLGATGTMDMYDPSTYPSTTFTMVQNGRAFFGLSTVSVNERIGLGGVGTFDLVTLTATVTTNCSSGLFIAAGAGNGVLSGTYTSSPAMITCDGSTQSQVITLPSFRVGAALSSATSPSTDFFHTTYIYSGSGGTVGYTDLTITITQFSD